MGSIDMLNINKIISNLPINQKAILNLNDFETKMIRNLKSDFIYSFLHDVLKNVHENTLGFTCGLIENHNMLINKERLLMIKRVSDDEFEIHLRLSDILTGQSLKEYLSEDVWVYLNLVKQNNFSEPFINFMSFRISEMNNGTVVNCDKEILDLDKNFITNEKITPSIIIKLLSIYNKKGKYDALINEYERHFNRYYSFKNKTMYQIYAENWNKRNLLLQDLIVSKDKLQLENNWIIGNNDMSLYFPNIQDLIIFLQKNMNYRNKKTSEFMLCLFKMAQIERDYIKNNNWNVDNNYFYPIIRFSNNQMIIEIPHLLWFTSNNIKNSNKAIIRGIYLLGQRIQDAMFNKLNKPLCFYFDFNIKKGLTYSYHDEETHFLIKNSESLKIKSLVINSIPIDYRHLAWQYIVGEFILISEDKCNLLKRKKMSLFNKLFKSEHIYDLQESGLLEFKDKCNWINTVNFDEITDLNQLYELTFI